MTTFPVKLHSGSLQIVARDVGAYNYVYGSAIPVVYEADITNLMEGRSPDDADHIAVMLRYIVTQAIKSVGKPADLAGSGAEPLDGCSMVAFYEPGKGVESARVTLTHGATGRDVIAYERTVAAAIRSANASMARLLKN